jgi:hypothetical protein
MSSTNEIIVGLILAYLLGMLSVHMWQAISFLSDRGLGPDGPTADRRIALAQGWNGLGTLASWRAKRGGITATSSMTHPELPPPPPAGWPACQDPRA